MNRDPSANRQSRNIIAVATATAALALAGCSERNEPALNPEREAATPTNTTTNPTEQCSGHLVSPKKYFNSDNTSNLQEDLDLLSTINSDSRKADLSDIATSTGIIYDSYNDPQYAEAIVNASKYAKNKNLGTPTVQQFLRTNVADVPQCGSRNDTTTKEVVSQQRSNTLTIGKLLVAGLSKKYASQGSDFAERGVQKVDEKLDHLVDSLR